jgi:dipeptidyl aminopeptidase/acylaminoacyl peptidase
MRQATTAFALLTALTPAQEQRDGSLEATAVRVEALESLRVFAVHDDAIWSVDGNGADRRRWGEGRADSPLSPARGTATVATTNQRVLLLGENGERADLGAIAGWGMTPVWSPDDNRLAFATHTRNVGEGGIWIVDDVGKRTPPRRLTAEGEYEDNPEFSPDGRWLAVSRALETKIEQHADVITVARVSRLEVVDLETGRHEIACERTGEIDDIAWSPHGRHVAFEVDGELMIVPMAGATAGPAHLAAKNLRRGGILFWSPDGRAVLTDRTLQTRKLGRGARPQHDALVLVPLAGDEKEIDVRAQIHGAAFDPTGRWVFVTCDRELHRANVATGEVEDLHVSVDSWSPVWCRAK